MRSPSAEYQDRLASRRSTHAAMVAADARLAYLRLALFAAGVVLAFLAWRSLGSWWWLALPVLAFAVIAKHHDGVIRRREDAARAVAFYERGLARIEDRWTAVPDAETGERFADPSHPYASDLDLFGRGSLFELLSIARTRMGEDALAQWLKQGAPPSVIAGRQAATAELAPLLDLREQVALAGTDVRAAVHGDALTAWGEEPQLLHGGWQRPAAIVLTAATIFSAATWMLGGSGAPLLGIVLVAFALFASHRPRIHRVLHTAGGWSRDLDILAYVLTHLEHASFTSPMLSALKQRVDTGGVAPSRAIRRLHRLVEMHDWQHNLIFAVIATPLLWDIHIAFAMEAWRRRYGTHLRVWLQAVGEFEALSSVATYRFERPDDAMPTLLDETSGARYEGKALGHPLLPAARMVRNDLSLGAGTGLLVISGSNMSGKSTMLRTVGINAVLALAGAPVRATSLRLTPLAIGATLRIQDSLQEGRSRFFAEITRVRELADMAGRQPPLLFLLDELFHGTNSHDRLLGAAGVLRTLLERGAIGLVTTHDLALTAVADRLPRGAVNVHFEDRFEEGEILFDYTMKAGPVTRSNAIALMRAVGLDVAEEM